MPKPITPAPKTAAQLKAESMKKIKVSSSTYDFNRPKRQVINRYSR